VTATPPNDHEPDGISRRDLLRLGAATAATTALVGVARSTTAAAAGADIEELTVAQIQAAMASGELSATSLVEEYLARIDQIDVRGGLKSIIELNPDAAAIAKSLDGERKAGHVRGPLHGVPILLKDNIDTGDRMQTTAGSRALVGRPPAEDATLVKGLRAAGAVILGKTNMSEWANFRSTTSTSGWSGRGHLCHNPYALDRNPSGSSSGSGAAVSANLTAVSLGSETDGSIVSPAGVDGVVGLKPTVGLVSRYGVIPISKTQDTVGPHTRTVADAAAVLNAIVSRVADPRDPATNTGRNLIPADYTAFLRSNLSGRRIGVARKGVTGYSNFTDAVFEDAILAMRNAGATIVAADIPTIDEINSSLDELIVLIWDFKEDLNAYLGHRTAVAAGNHPTMASIIAFNKADEIELKYFGQEWFEMAESRTMFGTQLTLQMYRDAVANGKRRGGTQGIDAVVAAHNLDAIVAPTGHPAWTTDLINADHFLGASSGIAAIAGYPIINVPMGNVFGLPVGISFMGPAFSEPKLIAAASGFEAATKARILPQFLQTLPLEQAVAPRRVRTDSSTGGANTGGDNQSSRHLRHL
jgi:amidase